MTSPDDDARPTADGSPEPDPLPESGDGPAPETEDAAVEIVEIVEIVEEADPTAHDLGLELPDDPDEARALLLREIMEARQEAAENFAMMQRVAADFDNFRRRVERDQAENVERASQRVIERLLPTLDSFDAAVAFEPRGPSEEKIRRGMESTRSQLLETLEREGFEPIPAEGEPFDPKVHEAVSGPGGDGDGDLVVTAELRRGYVMHGRVIRPSLVTVDHA